MDAALGVMDEQRSVEALYRQDAERLWRAVYAFASDPEIASDSVAEAYAQVIKRGSAVRDPAAWIWRAAFRIAAGALKARSASDPPGRQFRAEAGIPDRYADQDLLMCLQQLPAAQRAAVVLFYYADMPIREIAKSLGSNGLAVRANLTRGRKRLRQLLGDDHG